MRNFKYKKKYGQHFLHNNSIINKIVTFANIGPNDLVVEIGAGSGKLTRALAGKAKNVISYEIDTELKGELDKFKEQENVFIIYDDFLKRDIFSDIKKYKYENLILVSNLPYNVTTPIMKMIIFNKLPFSHIVIMVQKELADRFLASLCSRHYGSLSIFINYYYNVKRLFKVRKENFYPRPKVESVVLSLAKKKMNASVNEEYLFSLIKASFQQKRKTIKNNLKDYDLDLIEKILIKYGYTLQSRAEELPIELFIEIVRNSIFEEKK